MLWEVKTCQSSSLMAVAATQHVTYHVPFLHMTSSLLLKRIVAGNDEVIGGVFTVHTCFSVGKLQV